MRTSIDRPAPSTLRSAAARIGMLLVALSLSSCTAPPCGEPLGVVVVPPRELRVQADADGRILPISASLLLFKTPENVDCDRLGAVITVEPEDPAVGTLSHAILAVDWSSLQEDYDWQATDVPSDVHLEVEAYRPCGNGNSSGNLDEIVGYQIQVVTDYTGPLIVRAEPTIELCVRDRDVVPDYEFTLSSP